MDPRQQFLLEMYKQLMADINRHIVVVWQSVSVLVGAFALFALVEKKVISLDMAATLMVILCGWLYQHLLDASYWYNRNNAMISNIERQFLRSDDLRDIHYYWGSHRPTNRMIKHLWIQAQLGVLLALVVLAFHFIDRVLPGFDLSLRELQPVRTLPYMAALIVGALAYRLKKNRDEAYEEFKKNSPGITVDTSTVSYGVGHGFDSKG